MHSPGINRGIVRLQIRRSTSVPQQLAYFQAISAHSIVYIVLHQIQLTELFTRSVSYFRINKFFLQLFSIRFFVLYSVLYRFGTIQTTLPATFPAKTIIVQYNETIIIYFFAKTKKKDVFLKKNCVRWNFNMFFWFKKKHVIQNFRL